ncbi:MAG TPA: response regulator, partial [Gammaproteobacteria bacterium]|nr:response regulator [Gammaproteobacteria bacterium]
MNSLSDIVWIVDDDDSIRWVLDKAMQKASIETRTFADAESVLDALQQDVPSALITDIKMPGIDGLELLKKVQEKDESLPVIVITAHSDLDSTVSAYKGGAFEYLPKPFDIGEAVTLVKRAFAARHEQEATQSNGAIAPSSDFLGESPAMQEVFRIIGRLSASPINVLVTGESGTGKELVAKALHKHGPRASNPFIAINTAAIPRDLLESELFGHEKGAFTGAQSLRQGRFEQADGGTLFLDEIGDMPAELQTRLLRVLA